MGRGASGAKPPPDMDESLFSLCFLFANASRSIDSWFAARILVLDLSLATFVVTTQYKNDPGACSSEPDVQLRAQLHE